MLGRARGRAVQGGQHGVGSCRPGWAGLAGVNGVALPLPHPLYEAAAGSGLSLPRQPEGQELRETGASHPCIPSLHPCVGSGEREHPPPAWHKSWHRSWPRGWAGEGEGPAALGSPSLGTSCPSLGHRVPQFPRMYSGVGAVWSPWAACGAAWQRDPGLFAPESSALPSLVSLLSPRAGDGMALQGHSGLFCTLGLSASGIYSPSSRLLPPPPDSHTGAGVS